MRCWRRWRASRRRSWRRRSTVSLQAGLLFRQGVPPHASYLFKHALVQDAAYGTLLREPRRALHARIAETLESQFAEIAESQPEMLARHCTEAGLIEKAAGFGARRDSGRWSARRWSKPRRSSPAPLTRSRPCPARRRCVASRSSSRSRSITPLMHTKGFAGAGNQGGCGAGTSADRTSRGAGRASRRPVAVVLGPLRLLGRELCGVQWRRDVRPCGAVPGAGGEARRRQSRSWSGIASWAVSLAAYGRHRGRPGAFRSGDRALRPCRAPSSGDAIWPRRLGCRSCIYRSLALWVLGYPEAALRDADDAIEYARELGHAGCADGGLIDMR